MTFSTSEALKMLVEASIAHNGTALVRRESAVNRSFATCILVGGQYVTFEGGNLKRAKAILSSDIRGAIEQACTDSNLDGVETIRVKATAQSRLSQAWRVLVGWPVAGGFYDPHHVSAIALAWQAGYASEELSLGALLRPLQAAIARTKYDIVLAAVAHLGNDDLNDLQDRCKAILAERATMRTSNPRNLAVEAEALLSRIASSAV